MWKRVRSEKQRTMKRGTHKAHVSFCCKGVIFPPWHTIGPMTNGKRISRVLLDNSASPGGLGWGGCSGERPIGAAKGKQPNTEALCPPPPQARVRGKNGRRSPPPPPRDQPSPPPPSSNAGGNLSLGLENWRGLFQRMLNASLMDQSPPHHRQGHH